MIRNIMLIALAALCLAGCQKPDRPPEAPRIVENVYGISITLDLKDDTGAEEFYTVDRDGQLGFGGGMAARFENTPHTSMLSSEDMTRLNAVIDEQRLLSEPLASSNQPKDVRYQVKIRRSDDSINKSIKGDNARIEALRSVLREFANRRLEAELELQPKASAATQPTAPQR